MLVAGFDAADELVDGGGLVATGLVGAAELEFHSGALLPVRRGMAKPLLYSGGQVGALGADAPRKFAVRFG